MAHMYYSGVRVDESLGLVAKRSRGRDVLSLAIARPECAWHVKHALFWNA